VAWSIETTGEFQACWAKLSDAGRKAITIGVTVLEEKDWRRGGRALVRWQKIRSIRT
jgi:hypothetical protein